MVVLLRFMFHCGRFVSLPALSFSNVTQHSVIFAGRADPNCALGHVLKVLFKNDDFMTKVCSFECSLAVSVKVQ